MARLSAVEIAAKLGDSHVRVHNIVEIVSPCGLVEGQTGGILQRPCDFIIITMGSSVDLEVSHGRDLRLLKDRLDKLLGRCGVYDETLHPTHVVWRDKRSTGEPVAVDFDWQYRSLAFDVFCASGHRLYMGRHQRAR